MEKLSGVEKRYARALFRLCGNDTKVAKRKYEALLPIAELFRINHARKVLTSPVMPVELKKELLRYALTLGNNDAMIQKFIESIIEAGRIANLPGLIKAFSNLIDDQDGVIKAEVTTATPLDAGQMQAISQAVSRGNQVQLDQKVDPTILGGLIVRVGNSLVDLSLKTQLHQFAQNAIG